MGDHFQQKDERQLQSLFAGKSFLKLRYDPLWTSAAKVDMI